MKLNKNSIFIKWGARIILIAIPYCIIGSYLKSNYNSERSRILSIPFKDFTKEDYNSFKNTNQTRNILNYYPFFSVQETFFESPIPPVMISQELEDDFEKFFYSSNMYLKAEKRLSIIDKIFTSISMYEKSLNERTKYSQLSDIVNSSESIRFYEYNNEILFSNSDNTDTIKISKDVYSEIITVSKQLNEIYVGSGYNFLDERKEFYLDQEIKDFVEKHKYSFTIFGVPEKNQAPIFESYINSLSL